MKLILQFLKPHWKLTVLTVLLAVIDVGGSLFIPTPAAHLLNQGTSGVAFEELLTTGLQMGAVSLFSSICAILGGYACATLAARVGKDMRVALYEKSLKLSIYDFRQFGTASITTRTVSDITTIQFALTSFIQMVLPVPLVCIHRPGAVFPAELHSGHHPADFDRAGLYPGPGNHAQRLSPV